MDLVVGVAIGVLAVVFLGSLAALVLICRHRCNQDGDQKPILKYWKDQNASEDTANRSTASLNELELDDVFQLSPNIEKVLKDNQWIFDNTGLVEHCLAILRTCHLVSDKLSALSFNPTYRPDQDLMDDVRRVTKRVMPRVDDLVRSMYTTCVRKETHAALLEARAAALVMAVSNLALAFRAAYGKHVTPTIADWLNASFAEMECHVTSLREVAQNEEELQRRCASERVEYFPANSSATNCLTATQQF